MQKIRCPNQIHAHFLANFAYVNLYRFRKNKNCPKENDRSKHRSHCIVPSRNQFFTDRLPSRNNRVCQIDQIKCGLENQNGFELMRCIVSGVPHPEQRLRAEEGDPRNRGATEQIDENERADVERHQVNEKLPMMVVRTRHENRHGKTAENGDRSEQFGAVKPRQEKSAENDQRHQHARRLKLDQFVKGVGSVTGLVNENDTSTGHHRRKAAETSAAAVKTDTEQTGTETGNTGNFERVRDPTFVDGIAN